MKLREIAERLGLTSSAPDTLDIEINSVNSLERASADEIAYVADARLLPLLAATKAGAVICSAEHAARAPVPCLVSQAAAVDFARCTRLFAPPPALSEGVHPSAVIAPTATVAPTARIGACAVIGDRAVVGPGVLVYPGVVIYPDVAIGPDTVVHANCTLRERVRVGARCILHPNVVLGCDGFGFARAEDGRYEKIEQLGTVVIEDDVEIGSGTTIDRATFAETRIAAGTKIDNLVQIGHNCLVGRDTILCAQVGLAGSTTIGERVTLAGQVGVAGHLTIGDGAVATAQTGIPSSIEPGRVVSGYPAIDNRAWLKASVAFTHVPELLKAVRRLEARVAELESRTGAS